MISMSTSDYVTLSTGRRNQSGCRDVAGSINEKETIDMCHMMRNFQLNLRYVCLKLLLLRNLHL